MADAEPTLERMEATRGQHHPNGFVERPPDAFGLGVQYDVRGDGVVHATVACPPEWEGYPGLVHGGIIAALLDGAMTNAVFARGVAGYTAELEVKYHKPLELGRAAELTGEASSFWPGAWRTSARIEQDGVPCASCTAVFMKRSID